MLSMLTTAKRKGLKRYPFARFGLSGKRYKRKARSGRNSGRMRPI